VIALVLTRRTDDTVAVVVVVAIVVVIAGVLGDLIVGGVLEDITGVGDVDVAATGEKKLANAASAANNDESRRVRVDDVVC